MLTSPLLVLSLSCSISWGVPLHGSPDNNEVTEDKCYSEMSDPYRLFGSWTSYFAVDNERAQAVEMPGCRPKSFWMFVRHGSRRPSVGQINATNTRGPQIKAAVVKNHQDGKGHLCGKDLGAFMGKYNVQIFISHVSPCCKFDVYCVYLNIFFQIGILT